MTESLEKVLSSLDSSMKNIALLDSKGRFLYVNKAYENRCGYSSSELVGSKVSILKSGVHNNAFYQKLWDSVINSKTYHAVFTNKSKSGTLYCDEQTIIPLGCSEQEQSYLVIGEDFSQMITSELNDASSQSIADCNDFDLEEEISL